MVNENIKTDIVAFNEEFISCFINPIYSIVSSYNKSILPLLIDYIFTYSDIDNRKSNGLVFLNLEKQNNIFDLLKEIGINHRFLPYSKDIVNDIKKSLKGNKFVLTEIDCFAVPGIPRHGKGDYYYNNFHHSNYLLVYDYDDDNECFKIINSIGDTTKKGEFSYRDITNGYECYIQNCADGYGFVEFENISDTNNNLSMKNYIDCYINTIHETKIKIKQGLDKLDSLYNHFANNVTDNSSFISLKNKYGPIIPISLIKNSKIQAYQQAVLFPEEDEIKSIRNTITCNWIFLRKIVLSYKSNKEYDKILFIEGCNKFKEICELEHQYYDWLSKL